MNDEPQCHFRAKKVEEERGKTLTHENNTLKIALIFVEYYVVSQKEIIEFLFLFTLYFPLEKKLQNMSQKVVEQVQEVVEVAPVQPTVVAAATESKSKKSKSKNKKKENAQAAAPETVQPMQKEETIEDLSARTDSGIVDPPSEPSAAASSAAKKKSRSKKNKKSGSAEPEPAAIVQQESVVVSQPAAPAEVKTKDSKKKKSKNSSESKSSDDKVQSLDENSSVAHIFFIAFRL